MQITTYFNVRALADGAYLGRVGTVTLNTTGKDSKFAILDHVKSLGWDCNGVAHDQPYEYEVTDNLRMRQVDTDYAAWPLSNHHLKVLMGLPPKLPVGASETMRIGNVDVWLESQEFAKASNPGVSRPHRIKAKCPCCAVAVPAGRLAQHMKVHK